MANNINVVNRQKKYYKQLIGIKNEHPTHFYTEITSHNGKDDLVLERVLIPVDNCLVKPTYKEPKKKLWKVHHLSDRPEKTLEVVTYELDKKLCIHNIINGRSVGQGTVAMNQIIDYAIENGVKKIFGEMAFAEGERLKKLNSFYEKFGFTLVPNNDPTKLTTFERLF